MTTKRELILRQILSVLTPTSGVAQRVYRSRVVALQRSETPAILITPESDTATQETSLPTLDHALTVGVSVVVRGDTPDKLADDIVQDAHSRLMSDLSLSGNAIDIQPSNTSFELIDADQPGGIITTNYLVRYRTQVSDLSQ